MLLLGWSSLVCIQYLIRTNDVNISAVTSVIEITSYNRKENDIEILAQLDFLGTPTNIFSIGDKGLYGDGVRSVVFTDGGTRSRVIGIVGKVRSRFFGSRESQE